MTSRPHPAVQIKFSPEYEAVANRLKIGGIGISALVLIVLFVMVIKPS